MSLNRGKEGAEHLKGLIELYEKVKVLDAAEMKHEYSALTGKNEYYEDEDVDVVIDIFCKLFPTAYGDIEQLRNIMASGAAGRGLLIKGSEDVSRPPSDAGIDPEVLFLLSRPFFRSISRSFNADEMFWDSGKCPACGASPSISMLADSGKRRFLCSYCGTIGDYKRIGCAICHQEDPENIDIIYAGDDETARIEACNSCRSYVKTFIHGSGSKEDYELADIMSIALDIIAQGKGFFRRSPNAVGMSVIT